jgi:hypothetical protein
VLPLVNIKSGDIELLFPEGGSCSCPAVDDEDVLEARRDGGEDGLAALAVPDSAQCSFTAPSSR